MILYPAIDLKDGRCVRLQQGDMARVTVFNDDPAAQARAFAALGFSHLHVVDLDGAFQGRTVNAEAVQRILHAVKLDVQLGGGIRTLGDIERWIESGVSRVVLGTAAVKDPVLVREAARVFPGRVAVGIDARNGKVAVQGWAEGTSIAARDLALKFEDAGIAALIYTDIGRDGMLQGLNVSETAALARAVHMPVIASGGVKTIECIRAAKESGVIEGVIAGRAFYDGRLDAKAALALAQPAHA